MAVPQRRLFPVGAIVALSLAAPLTGLTPSAAAADLPTVRPTTAACPAFRVQSPGFTDITRSDAAREIACLVGYGVSQGVGPTTFGPSRSVSRTQLAVFVYRLGARAGFAWDTRPHGFTDVAGLGTAQQEAIDALANAGVVQGRADGTFAPTGAVTRGQLTAYLNRFQQALTGAAFPAGPSSFSDVDASPFREDIDAVASAGLAGGVAPGRFDPAGAVSRQQMAVFLARLLDLQVSTKTTPQAYAATCVPVRSYSTRRLAGAVLTMPVQSTRLPEVRGAIADGIGGVLLYGNKAPADLAVQLAELRVAVPDDWPLVVASDEEGGSVQRLATLTGGYPSARAMTAAGPEKIRADAERLGRSLKALGVTVDLAPVAGLDRGPGPSAKRPLGTRSFSDDPAKAGLAVAAFTEGLQDAGVVAVVKHFPGLGTATANTDDASASTAPYDQLKKRDLLPFAEGVQAGARAIMTSHAKVPGLSAGPMSLSPSANATLRADLDFQGAVFTDSLSAAAIFQAGFSVPEAAVQALIAGADDLLFGTFDTGDATKDAQQVRDAIVRAVQDGRLPLSRLQDAAARVLGTVSLPPCT